jgi:hypothetical protein
MAVTGSVMVGGRLVIVAADAVAGVIAILMSDPVGASDERGEIGRAGTRDRAPAERQAGDRAHHDEDDPAHARLIAGLW